MSKIKHTVIGFLSTADYGTYYRDIFKAFDNEFIGADPVSITMTGNSGGNTRPEEASRSNANFRGW
jgi:hypothetical protein